MSDMNMKIHTDLDRKVKTELSLSSAPPIYTELLRAQAEREQGIPYLSVDSVLDSIDTAIQKSNSLEI